MDPLTSHEAEILAVGTQRWEHSGNLAFHVRERFDLTPTAFYAELNALLDDPRALAHDPFNVRRLCRIREERQASRSARRLGVLVIGTVDYNAGAV